MDKYEHIRNFTVKYCEADFKDEIKVSSLLAYLEEVACSSADELGFGYAYVKPRGYAFMVANICCDFIKPISLGERITLKTWPTPPTRAIFGREYQVLSRENGVKLNASSRWCLLDVKTGKLLPSKAIDNQDYSTYNTTKLMEDIHWKIPVFSTEDKECSFSLKIANSEYDHNMHVNNTRYADYFLNCFSVQELTAWKLKKMMVSYVKQCKEGETLCFYRERAEDGGWLTQGVNKQNEIVAQAYLLFEE